MPDSFYVAEGDGFRATELTRGPWDAGAQHAGPPAALIGREIERLEGAEAFQVGRVTFEVLRPVPIGTVRPAARVVRSGRRVQLVEATLSDESEILIRASAWRLRTAAVNIPALPAVADPDVPGPGDGAEADFFPTGEAVGYHTAMDYRFVAGSFLEPGPATVWMRTRFPIVAGEEPSPLQRVLVAADSGNGVSATLDWRRYLFINVDLSVHLERMPAGEWVCLDATTRPERSGVGSADTLLLDERGRIGRALQTLLVSER